MTYLDINVVVSSLVLIWTILIFAKINPSIFGPNKFITQLFLQFKTILEEFSIGISKTFINVDIICSY
jgi:hypothetical protein